jgi:hypothetical protein
MVQMAPDVLHRSLEPLEHRIVWTGGRFIPKQAFPLSLRELFYKYTINAATLLSEPHRDWI